MAERGGDIPGRELRLTMRVDVNAFLGEYPYRRLVGATPEALLEAMDRTGVSQAWVSHLAAVFWRDPTEGNAPLRELTRPHPGLVVIPAVHPGLPEWEDVLREAIGSGAPAVRCDPSFYGLDPAGPEMQALAGACGDRGIPLLLAVRLEDGRQRHPNDRAAELTPAAVRALGRSDERVRLIVTHADREFVEQVHFGSTPAEAARILWDISGIWGPPEDHLALLLRTVGRERFTFGTGMPLRLPEASVAKLDLSDLTPEQRTGIEGVNLRVFLER